jgi:broad specificity phosphatase PhoE
VQQSIKKGAWMKEAVEGSLDFYVTSEYLRAIQTGHYMTLPFSEWKRDARFNERDWGPMDQISSRERTERWPTWKRDKEANPHGWRPHEGETLAEKQRAVHQGLRDLSEQHPRKRGIIVAHGETNLVVQACIENVTPDEFNQRERDFRMENTEIIRYKNSAMGLYKQRIHPQRGEVSMWQRIR